MEAMKGYTDIIASFAGLAPTSGVEVGDSLNMTFRSLGETCLAATTSPLQLILAR